jgi:hypothetical protein
MRGHAGRLTDSTVVLPRAKFPLHVFDFAQTKMIAQVKDDLVALNLETGNWAGDVLDAQGATPRVRGRRNRTTVSPPAYPFAGSVASFKCRQVCCRASVVRS